MRHGGYLVSDAHMRSAVVIEMYVTPDYIPCVFYAIKVPLPVDAFHFDNAVYTFGNRIVRRLVILCHADGNAMRLEKRHILVATILHSTVGVVYQSCEAFTPFHFNSLPYGLPQCVNGGRHPQGIGKHPSHDFMGIGIGNQVQVADIPICQWDISDIADSQLVG